MMMYYYALEKESVGVNGIKSRQVLRQNVMPQAWSAHPTSEDRAARQYSPSEQTPSDIRHAHSG